MDRITKYQNQCRSCIKDCCRVTAEEHVLFELYLTKTVNSKVLEENCDGIKA